MTFKEWLAKEFYPGFDCSGLTDEEYWELEDLYLKEVEEDGNSNDAYGHKNNNG